MIFSKYNRFTQLVTALHFYALGHQVIQHLIYRIGIKQPFVKRSTFYCIRRFVERWITEFLFVLAFFRIRQFIVFNPLALKL